MENICLFKKRKKKKTSLSWFILFWFDEHDVINIGDYFNGLQKVQTVKSAQTVKENQTNYIALGQSTPEYNLLLILF